MPQPPNRTTPHKVAEPYASYAVETPARSVRLFRNGANQAVRIPREFELPTLDATIRKVGNTLVIEPVPEQPQRGTLAALALALERIHALGPCDDEFPDIDEGLLPLDDIVL